MPRFDKRLPDSTPTSRADHLTPSLTRFGMLGAVLLLGLLLVPVSARADSKDVAKGKTLYDSNDCASCHGENGRESLLPTYPVIAGQAADYVYLALSAYKGGMRTGSGVRDSGHANLFKTLTEAQLHQLADYIGTMK